MKRTKLKTQQFADGHSLGYAVDLIRQVAPDSDPQIEEDGTVSVVVKERRHIGAYMLPGLYIAVGAIIMSIYLALFWVADTQTGIVQILAAIILLTPFAAALGFIVVSEIKDRT